MGPAPAHRSLQKSILPSVVLYLGQVLSSCVHFFLYLYDYTTILNPSQPLSRFLPSQQLHSIVLSPLSSSRQPIVIEVICVLIARTPFQFPKDLIERFRSGRIRRRARTKEPPGAYACSEVLKACPDWGPSWGRSSRWIWCCARRSQLFRASGLEVNGGR